MDVFLFPSLYEGLPFTAVEAQVNGLKCVMADTITKMVNISGDVSFLSLRQKKEDWIDTILENSRSRSSKQNNQIVQHEKIHLRQELEMFVVLFYLIYFTEFLVGCIKYNDRYKAYRNISFEREAFDNDFNPDYLKIRRL